MSAPGRASARVRAALGGVAATALIAAAALAQDTTRSTWSGVYSEAQATRGAGAYAASCQACHGANLQGLGEAKPLAGPEFLAGWNGLTVGDLFDRARTTMPMSAPKSLPAGTYADILAYVLKVNGFPAGGEELAPRGEALAQIRFDAWRPSARGRWNHERGDLTRIAWQAPAPGDYTPPPEGAPSFGDPAPGLPDPYVADKTFLKLPPGRTLGSTSAVAVDSHGNIWVADRCGANDCAGSDLDPILEFDPKGNFVQAFGAGRLLFPHGLFIDAKDHLWVTDGHAAGGKGADVLEFDATGRLLRTLGTPGVAKSGPDSFSQPNAVFVAHDGTIFVADGHDPERGVARIVELAPDGRFVRAWGEPGAAQGQMNAPHALAMDSRGRLFVADRWNNRIDIFDRGGRLLDVWTQFGRPSGIFIDRHDRLYSTDSESRTPVGYGHHPGWRRGVRIGSARTGKVEAFIPDDFATPDRSATSGGEGIWVSPDGTVWSAQVQQKAVVRYTPAKAGR